MRLLVQFAALVCLALSVVGASAQQLPTGPGHALAVYASCQGSKLNPFVAIAKLEEEGWRNESGETAFRSTVAESFNVKARAYLSETSYPHGFEESQRASPEEVSTNVRRSIEHAVFERRGVFDGDEPARLVFVLKAPEDKAIATIDFFRGVDYSHLICETTTHARLNPVLANLLLSDREYAGTRGASFERWRTSGKEVNSAYLLSPHAQQKDGRFETQLDLVLRSAFFERSDR